MAAWSSFRNTCLGENSAAAVRLADVLSRGECFASNDTGRALLPSTADETFAHGRYRAEEVRPYIQYFDLDLVMASSTRVQGHYPASLCINLIVKGAWNGVFDGRRIDMAQTGVPSILAAGQEYESAMTPTPGQHIRAACLYVGADFFQSVSDRDGGLLQPFTRFLKPGIEYCELRTCDVLRSIMHRLYDNPYHGAMARLYTESLSLSVLVELGTHVGGAACRRRTIPRAQRDRVHEARAMLDRELESPPPVRELARRLGISEVTLRRSFKAIFGTTIVDYVRHRRLDAARLLLREGWLRVSEIAYRVGYSDPANFTAAYRQRFGYPPTREMGDLQN